MSVSAVGNPVRRLLDCAGMINLLLPDIPDDSLLLRWRARLQKLFQVPLAVGAEPEGGMFFNQIHRLIENSALNGRDLGLVIRVADVEMDMRRQKERPFLLRLQSLRHIRRVSIHGHTYPGWRFGAKLGDVETDALLSAVLVAQQGMREGLPCDGKVYASGAWTLPIAHENVDPFIEGSSPLLKKDGGLNGHTRRGGQGLHPVQLQRVVVEAAVRDTLVIGGDRLQGNAVFSCLQPRSGKVDVYLGPRVGRIEGGHHIAHRVIQLRMQIEEPGALVDSHPQSGNTGVLNDERHSEPVGMIRPARE